MLVFALIAAFCLYVGLYWVYLAAQSHGAGATSILSLLNHILFMPEANIFFLLRGLILITFFYVIADLILSPARHGVVARRRRLSDAHWNAKAFKGVRAPQVLNDEDDDALDSLH